MLFFHFPIIVCNERSKSTFFKCSNIKISGSSCQCKDLINQNNVGNCKGKKPSQFRRKFAACYVTQPSGCTDLKNSSTNPGELLSVNACRLRGKIL